jgi:two-component system, response regulator, stage 0 sporulation protein A
MITLEKCLSVLLIEDDEIACRDIMNYIDELDDLELIGITNSSEKAVEYVKEFLPDAVILDLELHQGGGNGLLFLADIKQLDLAYYPYILITTNNTSTITYEYARQSGADFIMAKHQTDYSSKNAVDFLRIMKDAIQSKNNSQTPEHNTIESPSQRNKRIIRKINIELDLIGVSPKAVGYKYLAEAIRLIIDKPSSNLCAVIGEQFSKTDSSVERAMQNAINKAWRTSDINDLTEHYKAKVNSDKGVPTLTEFIYYYANKIKNQY